MKRRFSLALLGIAVSTAGVAGFAFETPLSPKPLQAQSACGRFSGLKCQDDCTKECSNGSCCSWSYYYYEKALIE